MEIEPIGELRTCFGSKFAVPRQPGLCPSAWGTLVFFEKYRSREAVREIEGFSHLWLIFGFHQTRDAGWRQTVRPPRLGGNQRVGVFASRSTFRPNGLGLSLVKLDGVDLERKGKDEPPILRVSGVDLVDGTPIYDVKPYLPYVEAIPDAVAGYAEEGIQRFQVVIEPMAKAGFDGLDTVSQKVIREVLSLDPRPAAGRQELDRVYGTELCGKNIRFRVNDVTLSVSVVEILEV